ncbi:MAG: UDP-glucose 4-epimerase GalE [Myxococcota bacterium]|nr:UDP-glucose 4-epimerase GalE [Myxococcota bacterium]
MKPTVLVVGGAGYIGSHCALRLKEAGYPVVVYDDLSTGHREAVEALGLPLVLGDIRDAGRLGQTLDEHGIGAVMHFAALALVGESTQQPSRYFEVNVGGTATLARLMGERGIAPLVFSSTCAVYGTPAQVPVTEAHPKAPESPYGHSKWMAEQVLEAAAVEGLRAARLRYFNAAGAHPSGLLGESHSHETHLIPLVFQAVRGERPPLQVFGRDYDTPDGSCIRDYIHVMDLADAHLAALEYLLAGNPGGAWNLGTGTGTSVLQILESAARVTQQDVPWQDGPRRDGDPARIWAQPTAAQRELGWSPRWLDLDEILATAWRWAQSPKY